MAGSLTLSSRRSWPAAGVALVAVVLLASVAPAQIPITSFFTPYTQDFNTLVASGTGSVMPAGWLFLESGTNANTTYTAGTGSGNAGDTYSFGASGSSERALGGLLSSSLVPLYGAVFVNSPLLANDINSLIVSYTGEQWRLGATGRADRLDFQYSLDATSLNTGTWVDVDALDFVAPNSTGTVGALDGNAAANRVAISSTIGGLSLPTNGTIWFRWVDFNATSSDDGLAIDDFSIRPEAVVPVATDSWGGVKQTYR